MRRSLKGKLILSYLAVALLTVLVVSVLVRLMSGQSLMNLVMEQQTTLLEETAQTYYTTYGSLDGFFEYYIQSKPQPGFQPPNLPPQENINPLPEMRNLRGVNGLVDTQYRALIPMFGYQIGETVPTDMIRDAIPVKVDNQTIAWIIQDTQFQFKLSAEEQLFLQRCLLYTSPSPRDS